MKKIKISKAQVQDVVREMLIKELKNQASWLFISNNENWVDAFKARNESTHFRKELSFFIFLNLNIFVNKKYQYWIFDVIRSYEDRDKLDCFISKAQKEIALMPHVRPIWDSDCMYLHLKSFLEGTRDYLALGVFEIISKGHCTTEI